MKKLVKRNLLPGCLLACLLFAGAAPGQQNFANPTIKSNDGSSLCLAASGGGGYGNPIVLNDCAAGDATQGFAVGADGRLHFGAAGGPFCVTPAIIQANSPLRLWPCTDSSLPQVPASQAGPIVLQFSNPGGPPTCVGFGNNVPGTPVQMYPCSINSPTFSWTPMASAAATGNCLCGIDSAGYLLDGNNARIGAAGPGNQFVYVLNGKLISQDGSGIAASGVAHVVGSNGAAVVGSNGAALQNGAPVLVDAQGRVYTVVNTAGSTFTVWNTASPPVRILDNVSMIVAQGAGNLNSALPMVLVGTPGAFVGHNGSSVTVANPNGILGEHSSGIIGHDSSGFMAATLQNAAIGSGISSNTGLLDVSTPASLNAKIQYLKVNSSAAAPPSAPAYHLSSFQTNPPNQTTWPLGYPLNVTFQHTGAIPANDSLNVLMQVYGSPQPTTLATNVSVAAGSYAIPPPASVKSTVNATLMLQDHITGQTISILPMIALIPPGATSDIGSGPLTVTSFVSAAANPYSWVLGSPFPVKWQYHGVIPQTDSLIVSMQINGSAQLIGLASNIPIAAGSYSIPAPGGIASNMIATLLLRDGITGNTLATLPGIALIPPAPAPAPPVAGPPANTAYHLTGFQTNPPNQTSWPPNNLLPVSWSSAGAPAPNQTVSVLMQWPGLAAPQPLSQGIVIPPGSTGLSVSLPAPNLSQSAPVTLTLRNDLIPSQYFQIVVNRMVASAAGAAPVATAPGAPAATPRAPQAAATISQFTAPAAWGNNALLRVAWSYSGTPAPTQSVIVMVQYSPTAAPRAVCQAAVSAGVCLASPPFSWSSLRVNTPGTLTLVDGVSKQPVVRNSVPITLSVR